MEEWSVVPLQLQQPRWVFMARYNAVEVWMVCDISIGLHHLSELLLKALSSAVMRCYFITCASGVTDPPLNVKQHTALALPLPVLCCSCNMEDRELPKWDGEKKKQVSGGLWGNRWAPLDDDWSSGKACEWCDWKWGQRGLFFSYRQKNKKKTVTYQNSTKTQITALIMIPLAMRPLPPTL